MDFRFANALKKMMDRLASWMNSLIVSLPNIIIAILVFLIVLFLSKYLSRIVLKLLKNSSLQASMKHLISKLVSVLVVFFGMFLILGILDLSKTLNTILAGAGVAGLAIGLALQGAISNTYSGIILSYIDQIKFGDWIQSNDYEGEVVDINLRTVTIKQRDNNLVYLPNKLVLENPIRNFSTTPKTRIIVDCGIAYSSDLEFVKKLVKQTVSQAFKEFNSEEEVIFIYKEFGESSINFETRFWVESKSALQVAIAKSKAIIAIKAAFDKNNINIPFPIRTLDFPKSYFEKNNEA
ncbi:mechanosensitive ion channel family protein [Aquiflexum gelatinilyticum]|uniref:Mechanosensitive ion channel family protein n=1 Tax=Aquiflexum gelatinilyticum TaxID=2961943 RepID=A0A9X2P2D1_9BACT|nr:mechanosensitive ion channel family protein [Aquiflexum gelatinilyticum]MCR9013567.1 mechanosensitive ion channel family protein [Aquiflexum gelatinilyticum]